MHSNWTGPGDSLIRTRVSDKVSSTPIVRRRCRLRLTNSETCGQPSRYAAKVIINPYLNGIVARCGWGSCLPVPRTDAGRDIFRVSIAIEARGDGKPRPVCSEQPPAVGVIHFSHKADGFTWGKGRLLRAARILRQDILYRQLGLTLRSGTGRKHQHRSPKRQKQHEEPHDDCDRPLPVMSQEGHHEMSLLSRSQAQRAGKGDFFVSSEIRATAAKPTCLGIATGLVVWYEW